jgi:hypothetical protein
VGLNYPGLYRFWRIVLKLATVSKNGTVSICVLCIFFDPPSGKGRKKGGWDMQNPAVLCIIQNYPVNSFKNQKLKRWLSNPV